jgi:hypothetical protein
MDEFAAQLAARGLLAPDAARRVEELESRAHLPLAREIHSFLYVGAALVLVGVGATVKDHLDRLGPATILSGLALSAAACFAYVLRRGRAFALGRVGAPTAAFDYVLYLACGLVGVFFSYLEWKWRLLGASWDMYLFSSGLLFAALAYRFDNRLVLGAALVNLAGWLGLRAVRYDLFHAAAKPALVAYGAVLVALAFASRRGALKPHFADTYLTFGVHLGLATLLTETTKFNQPEFWILLVACAALGAWSMRARRFDTFAAAVGYAYAASLACLLHDLGWHDFDATLWIVVLSSAAVLGVLLFARARFKEPVS